MCVFNVIGVGTDSESYDGINPQKTPYHNKRKKGKCIEACLERRCHFTSLVFSVEGMTQEKKRRQLSNWLLRCLTNGTGDTWQHAGMYNTVSP